MFKFWILAVFVAVVLLDGPLGFGGSSGDCGGGNPLQEVKDRSVLRISTDPAHPPRSFQTQSGELCVCVKLGSRVLTTCFWEGLWNGR